jgi:hypothetical protein
MQPRTHHRMTTEDRRLLQLWFDIHEWRDRYVELHGLGGHLKTGQLWTGQNRPVRKPPQARVL